MATQLLRRLVCAFRKHQWRIEHNPQTQGTEADCVRCGAHRSTYPGATEANLGGRSPSPDGHGYAPGGMGSGSDG
jgi:hypothetical protein